VLAEVCELVSVQRSSFVIRNSVARALLRALLRGDHCCKDSSESSERNFVKRISSRRDRFIAKYRVREK